MKASLLIKSTLFKKHFVVTVLGLAAPLLALCFYFSSAADFKLGPAALAGLMVGVFCLAAFVAFYLSKQVLEPLDHFVQTATEIARGDFFRKFSEESNNEVGRLARLLNYIVEDLRINKKRKVSEHLREKYKTKQLLENIADGVILTDSQNRISLMNRIAKEWFRVNKSAVEDESTGHMLRHEELVKFIREFSGDYEGKRGTTEISLAAQGQRKSKILQVTSVQIPVAENEDLDFVVTVLHDITREKEVDRLKTELVSMVAHELRSPLTCISGFSELLLDDAVERAQSEEYATIILKESNRLNDLINKFLDISKIEAGRSQIRKSPVDMRMLVQKVLDFNMQLADRKQIVVTFDAPEEISMLNLDRDMIEQAILNLFSNAVKYSDNNTQVQLRLTESDENLTVEVQDKGFGISEKALPHIFEKFYRVTDNEEARETNGTGLGLPLAKEIVEVHGGTIEVKSRPGHGSKFIIVLPKFSGEIAEAGESVVGESTV